MKKITLLLLLCCSVIFAQERVEKFELTPEGFPGYVVLEFESKSNSEIFTQIKKWAEYNIRNADYSNYSEIENEFLTYSVNYKDALLIEWMGTQYYSPQIDVELRFKDNKLRID